MTHGHGKGRWGTAIALWIAVLLFPVLDPLPLLVVALTLVVWAFPLRGRWLWAALLLGACLLLLKVPGGGATTTMGKGWALLLGSAFVAAIAALPRAPFLARALAAVSGAAVAAGLLVAALGKAGAVDWAMRERFESAALAALSVTAAPNLPEGWGAAMARVLRQSAELQAYLFPALLGLQSLAILALAWWFFVRMGTEEGRWAPLAPLREFRFNDQLVWLVIAGLLLVLLPAGGVAERLGSNALAFMGGLYALRGVAVVLFLASGLSTFASVLLGALAGILLPTLVPLVVLLVGLGDTWLDVRGRGALASRG